MSEPISQRRPRRARVSLSRWALALLAPLLLPSGGIGSATDPKLVLSAAASYSGTSARIVRIEGAFHSDDLVQLALPFQVLIWRSANPNDYVRYDLSGGAVTGRAGELTDGLNAAEAVALLATGTPDATARVLFLGPSRLELLLPNTFPGGAAWVQMYSVDATETVLSNPLGLTLGASS